MVHARETIFTFVHHSKSKQSIFIEYFISDFLIVTVMYTIVYHVNYRLYANFTLLYNIPCLCL